MAYGEEGGGRRNGIGFVVLGWMDGVQMIRWRSMDGICTITGFMHYTDFLSNRMCQPEEA